MTDVTIQTDEDGRRVILRALDLYQRVAMGQWREIVEHAPNVVGDNIGVFGILGDDLMACRRLHTIDENLRHPNAALGIRRTQPDAQIACDLWHALGGGMPSRQDDRLTTTRIEVT